MLRYTRVVLIILCTFLERKQMSKFPKLSNYPFNHHTFCEFTDFDWGHSRLAYKLYHDIQAKIKTILKLWHELTHISFLRLWSDLSQLVTSGLSVTQQQSKISSPNKLIWGAYSAPQMYKLIRTSFLILDKPSKNKIRLFLFTGGVFPFHYLLTQTKRVKHEGICRHNLLSLWFLL